MMAKQQPEMLAPTGTKSRKVWEVKRQRRSGQVQHELERAGSPLVPSVQPCGHGRVSGMGFILTVHIDRASEKVLVL